MCIGAARTARFVGSGEPVATTGDEGADDRMGVFREIFSWWNGQTIGTRLFTARNGRFVGEDELGNRYYQTKDGKRRWVIYKGEVEASKVTSNWHGWLHHTFDEPPSRAPLPTKAWEQPHTPNMTGTPDAYRPKGSLNSEGGRPKVAGDYEAWSPEN